MKKTLFIQRLAMALFIVAAGCAPEPEFQTGVDCGGCEDPGSGTIGPGGSAAVAPVISSFNPTSGYTPFLNTGFPGTGVSIYGTGFSATAGNNIVRFNNSLPAQVISATATHIAVTVPGNATTG